MTTVVSVLLVLATTVLALGLGLMLVLRVTDIVAGGYTTTRARRRAERRKGYVLR